MSGSNIAQYLRYVKNSVQIFKPALVQCLFLLGCHSFMTYLKRLNQEILKRNSHIFLILDMHVRNKKSGILSLYPA